MKKTAPDQARADVRDADLTASPGTRAAAPDAPGAAASHADLLLKINAPRLPAGLLPRASLDAVRPLPASGPVVLVQAPPGYGKTSLLAQWRREFLARGAAVAWVTAQASDDPARFTQALALAVRAGAGQPRFGQGLANGVPADGLDGVTSWLAAVARLAVDVVLIVDEAEQLPTPTRKALAHVLRGAPANLRVVVAARAGFEADVADLRAYGLCAVVDAAQLRFRFEETLALVAARLGDRVSRDDAARLHELTEGWPLGLQLSLSAIEAAGREAPLPAFDAPGHVLREQFVAILLRNLAPQDAAFLARVACVEHLHPALAEALTGDAASAERLARLVRDTPLFMAGVEGDWLRLHAIARAELLRRFEALPEAERRSLHARAAAWLAAHGMPDVAAHHALDAHDAGLAYDLAERGLYAAAIQQGQIGKVQQFLARLPDAELDRRPRLLLAAAWAHAAGERYDQAGRYVQRILAGGNASADVRCECALILTSASSYADDPDELARLHDPWMDAPPLADPALLQLHANRSALRLFLDGQPGAARLRVQRAPQAAGYLTRWGQWLCGFTLLWEGRVDAAYRQLATLLATVDAELGRRSSLGAMTAALLAAARWEQGHASEVAALLADRIDVLERVGVADCVAFAFVAQADAALAAGAEDRALASLAAMDAVGIARGIPRLRVIALAQQVRVHARHAGAAPCADLVRQIDEIVDAHAASRGPLWRRSVSLWRELAHAHAAVAGQQWTEALASIATAERIAKELRCGAVQLQLMGLRALVMDRCGDDADALLAEAIGLARTFGLRRVFDDAHPQLALLAAKRMADDTLRASLAAPAAAVPSQLRVLATTALTPKEREIVALLARNLSNKEIALALQIGELTVKWHVRNLFDKLDAGSRKQVVARARTLGLLVEER